MKKSGTSSLLSKNILEPFQAFNKGLYITSAMALLIGGIYSSAVQENKPISDAELPRAVFDFKVDSEQVARDDQSMLNKILNN